MRARGVRLLAALFLGLSSGVLVGLPAHAQSVDSPFAYELTFLRSLDTQAPIPALATTFRGVYTGSLSIALAPNAEYRLAIVERAPALRVGIVHFTTGPNGSRFEIPDVPLRTIATAHDTDQDGLPDFAESVIGSNPESADSDGDGVTDLAEFLQGTSPADVTASRTGLVASVDTPGVAGDVTVQNDLAVICDGANGIVCANVFNGLAPRIVARVDTQGEALRASVSGTLIAVADGSGGLAVIDFADPPAAAVIRRVDPLLLGGTAQAVVAVADLAFVGLATGLVATVDMRSGSILERVPVSPEPIVDVTVAGDALYVLDAHVLRTLPLKPGALAVAGSAPSPFLATPNARVSAGGGVAYVTHGRGVNTFSLADPLSPVLIQATNSPQLGWKHFVVNGSGLGLAAVGANASFDGAHDVSLYDARDPAVTTAFLGTFPTPGVARAVAIYNGLCYVADHENGLQVVSYVPQDRAGIAPTISLSTSAPSIDAAEEGQLLRLSATVTDDVQVRNVELYVDGLRIATDGAFPFETFLVTPRRVDRSSITVRARASDTGGNATWTDEVVIQLTPDSRPPQVTRLVPGDGSTIGVVGAVVAFTSEPLETASVSPATFTVVGAGPDRAFDTADDVVIGGTSEARNQAPGAFFTPSIALAPGRYRATLAGATDQAGHALPTTTWTFLVYGSLADGAPDTDGDGIPDELELALGLDPANGDSNGNGIPDGQEDLDGDGVPNAIEVILGFDLTKVDSDGNGIADRDEDRDFDRLPDWREIQLGTKVFAVDSDGDGFTDGDEVADASDPLDGASTPIRALASATSAKNLASPERTLGSAVASGSLRNDGLTGQALGSASARNDADPQRTLGHAVERASVRNDAAPEAVSGSTSGKVTSVRNAGTSP